MCEYSRMGRPFTASDEQILQAAGKVIARRGPEDFTLAEVAGEVGLSRAAIILRFKSTQALKVTLLTQMVERFARAVEVLPTTPSGNNLLELAAFIGGYVGTRESSAKFFASYTSNIRNRELFELEKKRGAALQQAISRVMPKVGIDHESAVIAFRTHLAGTIMAWLSLEHADSRIYMVMRTREWLKLAGVAFDEAFVQELTVTDAVSSARKKPAGRSVTPRVARARKRVA
jgi:TetR/AcrR family macrolide resistance operon transcriptional repressor